MGTHGTEMLWQEAGKKTFKPAMRRFTAFQDLPEESKKEIFTEIEYTKRIYKVGTALSIIALALILKT